MKSSAFARYSITFLFVVSLLSPAAAFAVDHKKHFKEGLKYEEAEEWDKAAESFALAVVEEPKNPEYRLHLRRSLFNASQMFMAKGRLAAEQKDYQAAYVAYRKAYTYDPVNELAKAEMDKMVRLQEAVRNGDKPTAPATVNGVKVVQTSLTSAPAGPLPQKIEQLRDVVFPSPGVDLQSIIKELARELDYNVLFDSESFRAGQARRVVLDMRSVSRARALDYIFLQENLFFQKVGPRTILVANAARRPNFQQLVLRTFYLANASPKDIKPIIQAAIPAQPGRNTTIVLEDTATNSITIRDTQENINLIGRLISSLDKDRAEVVMDVAIYEVSKTDLLKFGNQIGLNVGSGQGVNQLNNLGGTNPGALPLNGDFALGVARSIAMGILIPSMSISAFQSKGNTKLLASTQIHAFNNEDSEARIGQRVPVRSATFAPVGTTPGNNNNNFVGDVITYEQVGLTLKFKPIVFPNQDVQVAMSIESKDRAASSDPLTPVFTERSIKGSARIQNNKTLLLASVAQGNESVGRQGLPVLGWIPIIGRLFATPTRDRNNVDIVIAVTPRVLRAPSIVPEDEAERFTGSVATPTGASLEATVIQEERDELLAAARKLPTTAQIQMPDRATDLPQYTASDPNSTNGASADPKTSTDTTKSGQTAVNLKPIDTSTKTLQINQTADTSVAPAATASNGNGEPKAASTSVGFSQAPASLKAGESVKVPVVVDASMPFRSALLGLKFDPAKFAVRSVSYGDVFGSQVSGKSVVPFLNKDGKTYVTLAIPDGVSSASKGILAVIEVEALTDSAFDMMIDKDVLNFLTEDGKNFAIKVQ
ncbi:MAG TPA: secretin N-terminal domain-containing protein [Pyrinomonadaceae bacterium]|nr:secretin N-terminal domain-containing protein [Pyrinomonadaceae bacterium]